MGTPMREFGSLCRRPLTVLNSAEGLYDRRAHRSAPYLPHSIMRCCRATALIPRGTPLLSGHTITRSRNVRRSVGRKNLGCVRVRVHALNVTQCHPFVDARFATCGRAFTLPSARISAWHRDRKSAERAHFKCRRRRGAPRRRIEAESIDQRVTACSALLGRARKWALVVGLQKPFQSGRVKRKMGQLSEN